jgi:hypothetical protein
LTILTTIDDSPAEDGSLGFSSVVTSGFSTPDDNDFKCNGDVQLSAATTASGDVDDDDDASDCTTLCPVEGARGEAFLADTSYNDFKTAIAAYINVNTSTYGNVINCWNVAVVTSMFAAFLIKEHSTKPINCWNTGSVSNMQSMFLYAGSYDQDFGNWNTAEVVNFINMFSGAIKISVIVGPTIYFIF